MAAKTDGEKAAETSIKQVETEFDKAQQQGFFGVKVDPLDNSAHSLESGPDAPTVAEQAAALAKKEA